MKTIDLKHHIEVRDGEIEIVKTGNRQPIPNNEPLCLFRARDYLAVPLLEHYKKLCAADGCNDFQLGQVEELIERFRTFARENPQTMKQPGITRGL